MKNNKMTLTIILSLIIIGLLAGTLSGAVGVGGGVIMVPLALLLLGFTQHQAQGLSLAVLSVPVTLLAAYTYHNSGSPIEWRYAIIIAIAFVIGGYFGAKIAANLNELTLKRLFGLILFVAAVKLMFFSGPKG
jgi:hypothetical protein